MIMKTSVIFVILFACIKLIYVQAENEDHKNVSKIDLTPPQMIKFRGFEAEDHTVTTRDGYKLTINRIINPLMNGKQLKRPILFVHGLLQSGTSFLFNSDSIRPRDYASNKTISRIIANGTIDDISRIINKHDQNSMAFLLSNCGYDIYLLNLRGNDFSLGHVNLSSSSDAKYWDFSIDEHVSFDVPDTIDYIRIISGAEKIGYVGHSLGTFISFALLAEYPEYSSRIEPVIALAPVAYTHHITSPVALLNLFYAERASITQDNPTNYKRFPPFAKRLRSASATLCYRHNPPAPAFCRSFVTLFCGPTKHVSPTGVIFLTQVFTTSKKVITQCGQSIIPNRFCKFDYGPSGNKERYGSLEPPSYDVGKINSKSLVFFYGRTDNVATVQDVNHFLEQLKVEPLRKFYMDTIWNHIDPIVSDEVGEKVNLPSLQILEQFESGKM